MSRPTVVLDTNLFVAAFWNARSSSAWIIEGCEHGSFALVYTSQIRRELERILREAKTTEAYRGRIASLLDHSMVVEPKPVSVKAEDRDDQKFLECAAGVEADYIVTSDEHLLTLRQVGVTAIVTPAQFRRGVGGSITTS